MGADPSLNVDIPEETMRRSKRAEAVIQSGLDFKASDEITSAWNGLAQSKAALRQIENKLEAGPGSGVLLESVVVSSKKKPSRKDLNKDGQQRDQKEKSTKMRSGHSRSPEKSSSRGPLQNSTQENTARNSVEFREPLASYREATPPPHPSPQPELGSLQSATGSSYSSQLSSSNPTHRLVYERESRDKQTDEDVDSTHSSTVERMEIRYLNDLPALDTIRTNVSHSRELTREAIQQTSTVKAQLLQSTDGKGSGSTPSTSPGSASQRLENLRRHQPDDKLEKLKERIRKQRQHLEEAAEKEKFGSYLEQPIVGNDSCGTSTIPSVKVRKVASAPSAPIYKGFNSTQMKIQTPDGKIWREEDFHNLSCGIYKDLSHQFAEGTRSLLLKGHGDFPKERKSHKSVRKVQKVQPISDLSRPAISPASWREGQKLVTMILGKNPIVTTEESQKSKRLKQKGSRCRSSSEPGVELHQHKCAQSTARQQAICEFGNTVKASPSAIQEQSSVPVRSDMSDDIKGILDDLQLQCKHRESDERAHATSQRGTSRRHNRGNSGSRSRTTIPTVGTASARGCRSASPSNRSKTVNRVEPVQKKRHYDADTVRQYIAQQQEKRKRQQMQEKNVLMKEAEQRQQRLQELYRKQREAALTVTTTTATPAQVQLKKTFNKLLHEGAQRTQEATQLRPMYQPSGESDKENRRLEQAQSLSSSDQSLNPLPVSRNDFNFGADSSAHLGHLMPTIAPVAGPVCSNEHLLSQLLRLESAIAASEKQTKKPITALNHSPDKMSRIEALKATATFLSNRIESEACKLAVEGFNYGLTTAVDADVLSTHAQGDDRVWTESDDMAFNTERMSGSSMPKGSGFPKQDCIVFKIPKEKHRRENTGSYPQTNTVPHNRSFQSVGLGLATAQEEHSEKNWQQHKAHPDHHNSSESLSEGPLSEGSLTDGDCSPLQSANAFRPIGHQGAVQHSGRKSHQRLSEFQKDAEKFAVVNSLLTQQENPNPVWEEFNKGSPLSVINIFTKTLQENVKVGDIFSERNSPSVHWLPSGSHVADLDYENDPQRDAHTSSYQYEELMRRSTGGAKATDPSASSPQRSSCSTPGSSPHSKNSIKMRDQSAGTTLVEEHRSTPLSEALSLELRKWDSKRSSENSQITPDDISRLSHRGSNVAKMSPPPNNRQSPGSLDHSSLENTFSDSLRRSSPEKAANTSAADIKPSGELQYSPAVLQQRLAAELHYLESIEESVRQLGDIERLMGVSKAQHESETLSHMLKAKQQQHEQELYELKIKAEREALETKLQMEQNRQRVARAHIDLQEGLATTHKETLEGLQEATTKMMSQQAEAARYTADTARHIKEMTEMAHAHLIKSSVQPTSELLKKRSHARMRDNTNLSYESSRTGEDHLDHSESESYRSPGRSEPDLNYQHSLSSEHKDTSHEPLKERSQRAEGSISIEDEVSTVANESLCNSLPSLQEEKGDTTSVATDYSHKFEESITEDEIEERSFRSLLPSEAHRRESLDRKLQHHNESEEDGMSHNCTPALVAHSITQHQQGSSAFSGGQDSFSHFTMEMVRQYMRDEEVRLQHQSALLRLRQKALKEKTRTELAWLEHQKKKLRGKGEDDKMPPIKKKQRGLLLKLQQEQAEIKRLQEANKAARKERQVLLKQQEEIERMRSSTLKLKERLRFAVTEAPSETSLSEVASSNLEHTDLNVRSPSPSVSISGSETSSIMQKLKKMRSQTDEKFLTKREQQLMQRRHHAEELLQWKRRLDKEEAEVLKMEKKALAAWDEQPPQNKGLDLSESEKDFRMSQGSKDFTGDFNPSSATPESSIHTDVDVKQGETSKSTSASDMASIQSSPANYTDDFASVSPSPNRPSDQKSPIKESIDVSASEHEQMSKLGDATDNHDLKQSEHISDQRDIETRIRTLKEELKKRKLTAYQLKKEQKKRTKQRLKAQEANLLKQLETYNDFIEKTKAELEQQPDSTPDVTSQITDGVLHSAEHPSETTTRERSHLRHVSESDGLPSFVDKAHPGQKRSVSMASTISEEEPPTLTPTPRQDSPDLCLFSKQSQAHTQEFSNQNVTSEHEVEKQEKISPLSKHEDKETKMDTTSECISPHPPFNKVFEQHVDSRSEEVSAKSPRSPLSSPLSSSAADVLSSVHSPEGTNKENRKVFPPLADNNEKSFSNSDQSSLKKNAPGWTTHDSREEEMEEIVEELSGPSVDSSYQSLGDARDKGEIQADGRMSVTSNHSVSPLIIDEMAGFYIGDRVLVSGVQPGTLRFKGSTSFANGYWAGVELDKSEGSNNGTYDGVLYFECSERHGIFAPPDKVTHLTDKFDMYTDTTEDDDSFHDEMPKEGNQKLTSKETRPKTDPFGNCLVSLEKLESGDPKSTDDIEQLDKAVDNYQHHDHTIVNGNTLWVSGDASLTPLIDNDKVHISKQSTMEITNLIEKPDVELDHQVLFSSDLKRDERRKDRLGSLADDMLNNIVKDAVQHFAELKKSKVKKIHDANQMNRNKVEDIEETLAPSVEQKDGLPFFLTQEKEEMSSPELCNRPESPVLGASGQEELAKRLAELELSREMEEFGDDQDWFDEDYGLSSRRQQQRLKEKQLEEDQAKFGVHFGKTTSGVGTVMGGPGDQQVKTPPRPELPHPIPPKLPEEPAMVVPHSAAEIEKIAHAAVLEIWKTCGLDSDGSAILTNQQNPNPSQEYYGGDSHSDDQEAACLHSYKKAVYDLTWEILQDVFAEDPNTDQPQWVKPQRVKSSSFHEIRTARDVNRIQRFVSAEILKLYGLATDQCQRTDWPKMLKFGRKKRDRVDNILVQELHEEESQWVNYDEDELFVKMQLADSIFDALLKDTADALNLIYEKRAKRDAS